jgi:4-hydroxy-2-oxoglutarate aldolase
MFLPIKEIRGVFAPIATAFDSDGNLNLSAYSENVAKFGETRLAGLVVLGSNGEFALLNYEEKVKLLEVTRKKLPAGKILIAGTGCEATRDAADLTKRAADAGADAALVINPHYHKRDMNELSLETFFTTVADVSPIPIILYNMPGNSGINLSSSLILRLARHPNIIGVKDSSGNIVQISEIIAGSPDGFSVFAGSGSDLCPTTLLGGKGGTLAVANVVPNFCADLYEAAASGNVERAKKMQLELLALNAAVTAEFGIGGLKAAMDMAGYYGGSPRLPILPATGEVKEKIRKILDTFPAEQA